MTGQDDGAWGDSTTVDASVVERVAARLVDTLVVSTLVGLGFAACYRPLRLLLGSEGGSVWMWVGPLMYVVGLIIAVQWLWWWSAKEGRSPGRAVMGLELVGWDDQPIGYGPVATRYIVKSLLEGCTLGIGMVINFVVLLRGSEASQALHDKVVRSRVVRFEPAAGGSARQRSTAAVPERQREQLWPGYVQGTVVGADNPWVLPDFPDQQNAPAGDAATPYVPHGVEDPTSGGHDADGAAAEAGFAAEESYYADDYVPEEPTSNGHGHAAPVAGALEPEYDQPEDEARDTDLVWLLSGADGQQLIVDTQCMVGRRPEIPDSESGDVFTLPIRDTELTMSKTHAMMGVDDDGLWVMDWGSRNGTFVAPGGENWEQLEAQQAYRLLDGDVIRFGKLEFAVSLQAESLLS